MQSPEKGENTKNSKKENRNGEFSVKIRQKKFTVEDDIPTFFRFNLNITYLVI